MAVVVAQNYKSMQKTRFYQSFYQSTIEAAMAIRGKNLQLMWLEKIQ